MTPPSYARDPTTGVERTHACCVRRTELEAKIVELEGAVAQEQAEKEAMRGESQALRDRLEFVEPMYLTVRRTAEETWAANVDMRTKLRGAEAEMAEITEKMDMYRGAARLKGPARSGQQGQGGVRGRVGIPCPAHAAYGRDVRGARARRVDRHQLDRRRPGGRAARRAGRRSLGPAVGGRRGRRGDGRGGWREGRCGRARPVLLPLLLPFRPIPFPKCTAALLARWPAGPGRGCGGGGHGWAAAVPGSIDSRVGSKLRRRRTWMGCGGGWAWPCPAPGSRAVQRRRRRSRSRAGGPPPSLPAPTPCAGVT